jgi:putative peptidoglycan lipid II flippase
VNLLAPVSHQVPGKFELAVKLTRVMFPFLLLVALAAQAMGVLNACNRFGVPALASTFFNIGSVVFGYSSAYVVGPHLGWNRSTGMAIGVVLGGALQLAGNLPSAARSKDSDFIPGIDWNHPRLREIFRLMGPAILGNAAVQINVMVNTNFASRIRSGGFDGPVSWLRLFVPLHAASARIVRRGHCIGDACRPSRAAPGRRTWTNSAARFPNRSAWCFCSRCRLRWAHRAWDAP